MVLWKCLSKPQSVLQVLLDILLSCYKTPLWFWPWVEEGHGARRMFAFLLAKEGLQQESEEFISICDSLGYLGVLNIEFCFLKTWKITKVMFRRAQNWKHSQLYFGMCKVRLCWSPVALQIWSLDWEESIPSTQSPSSSFDLCFVSLFSSSIMPTLKNNPVAFLSCADDQLRPSCWTIGSGLGFLQYRKFEVYA